MSKDDKKSKKDVGKLSDDIKKEVSKGVSRDLSGGSIAYNCTNDAAFNCSGQYDCVAPHKCGGGYTHAA